MQATDVNTLLLMQVHHFGLTYSGKPSETCTDSTQTVSPNPLSINVLLIVSKHISHLSASNVKQIIPVSSSPFQISLSCTMFF